MITRLSEITLSVLRRTVTVKMETILCASGGTRIVPEISFVCPHSNSMLMLKKKHKKGSANNRSEIRKE